MRLPWRRRTARHALLPAQRTGTWVAPALPPEPSETAVRLGFADGTEVDLPAEDPRARALRAVADSLVQESPATAEN
jgi:hypothetical protein